MGEKPDKLQLNKCFLIGEVLGKPTMMNLGKKYRYAAFFWIDVSRIWEIDGASHLYSFKIRVRALDNVGKWCFRKLDKGMMVRVEGALYEERDHEFKPFLGLNATKVRAMNQYNA